VLITYYPFWYVFSASISTPQLLAQGTIYLIPRQFYIETYRIILREPSLWRAYYNTVWYVVVGTLLNVIFTLLAAYPLSRKEFTSRNIYTFIFVFTMFFSGGLIPFFILINRLGMYNTRWAMVVPGLIAVWNLVICRTYIQTSIPDSLIESARIEGANEFNILFRFILPLSRPIIATLIVFYGVGHWNTFFNALIFLPRPELQPLQVYLRRILLASSGDILRSATTTLDYATTSQLSLFLQIKYAVIIVAIVPIMMIYPFMQKYFMKGIMIGALKG
jgi:putative aldouronate transport system permease protein